jgi:hypothetical protein
MGIPLPFVWECTLNPLLMHYPIGQPAIIFDVGNDPSAIVYAETGPDITVPMSDGDRAQPATYPFLTFMEIKDVADDTAPSFPWPVWVTNERGNFTGYSLPIVTLIICLWQA